jgi:hypothetical protein
MTFPPINSDETAGILELKSIAKTHSSLYEAYPPLYEVQVFDACHYSMSTVQYCMSTEPKLGNRDDVVLGGST